MHLNDLKDKLRSAGLYPIHIEGSADKDDARGLAFVGELEGYIEAVRALNINAVFIISETLEEYHFIYVPDEEDSEGDDESVEIDLPSIVPALGKLKSYIGQECRFKLSAPISSESLEFFIEEAWWIEFSELWGEAVNHIVEEEETKRGQLQAEQAARNQALVDRVRGLINDDQFVRLPTQRAMQEYARDRITGLESLDELVLKEEIQALDAKSKARGLGRKH